MGSLSIPGRVRSYLSYYSTVLRLYIKKLMLIRSLLNLLKRYSYQFFQFCFVFFGPHMVVLRAYSWLCHLSDQSWVQRIKIGIKLMQYKCLTFDTSCPTH